MIRIFLILTLLSQIVLAQERPKLVVGIVVDQMKAEYLYRFYDDFGNDGFKKLMKQGFEFKNTHFNYFPTYTAPGHSSLYTGTTPAVHGIVGNTWYHKSEQKRVYCVNDDRYKTVGDQSDPNAGQASPFRLETTTITDELKLATNFKSKVIGISIKDRGAVLPAGHFADAAYWMNKQGNFVSSSFYHNQLPQWVTNYNNQKRAEHYLNQGWDLMLDKSNYTESIADNNNYERVFKTKTTPTFPYDLKEIATKEGIDIIKTTPYGNNMVAELALEAIQAENLGNHPNTDFLAISFSSTDYVGHSFAPMSVEIQDTYIRLDKTIAHLLKQLDKQVGKGNYLLFLTADHAAAQNSQFLKDKGYNQVSSFSRKVLQNEIETFVKNTFNQELLLDYYNQNIFLDEELIAKENLDYKQVTQQIKNFVMSKDYVKRVYTKEEVLQGNPTDVELTMFKNGFDPKQNGNLLVQLKTGYMESYGTGTTHGSSYSYDTHVPNLWYGWNIKAGKTANRKTITQIAPTISMLLNIGVPNGSRADVLAELFD